jgi:hypothetical protein
MTRFLHAILALIVTVSFSSFALAQNPPEDAPEKKFGDFAKLVKGAKEYEGLFKLHQKDDHVYMEIPPHQYDKPLLAPIAIARGLGLGGETLNFDEQWVLMFKRVGDRIQVIRRNVRFQAKPGSPVARAVETTYSDSVLLALKIQAINPAKNAVVVDLNDMFFTDFAELGQELGLGQVDPQRTSWAKVKAFKQNIELEVSVTFHGGRPGGDSIIDSRGKTVVVHYGLVELAGGYQSRVADDRVGYFLTAIKDYSTDNRDTPFVRYVNRWRLERADGSPWKEGAKLVPPKKKIIFWIENSVPDEYRSAVREGILEWNKAFEKIGFKDAIEVRQQESEDFDPEDINYNTFRWLTHDRGYAIGPSRANPLTGEILDADITFDASMVRYYKMEHPIFQTANGLEEPASPMQAMKRGWGLPQPLWPGQGWNSREKPGTGEEQMREHFRLFQQGFCQCASHKRYELSMAAMAWMARNPGEKVPEEMILQAIKETTMHEVGHTLGLRHNFKASTMLKNEQLHDTAVTRAKGLSASVMDYHPVNIAPKGVKQGDWFTSTIGPYDYWAIEYAYKPLSGGTEGETADLQKIAARSPQPDLIFGTDEDLLASSDPNINQWDLGADPMKYAQDRIELIEELMKGLADRVVDKGDGYQRARQAFSMLLRQYGDMAFLVSKNIGGEYMNRDHRGDTNARDPFVPVKGTKQRDALKFLQDHVLTDRPFQFPSELLRKLAADRWMHWGNERQVMSNVDFPLHERILAIQRVALNELLAADTLSRLQNLADKTDKDDQPLQLAEVFRSLTDCIWLDLMLSDKGPNVKSSIIRRNLQREYLQKLTAMVLGPRSMNQGIFFSIGGSPSVPPDARSLARFHLKEITKRIDTAMADKKFAGDETVRAHLEECKERIAKALNASLQANE